MLVNIPNNSIELIEKIHNVTIDLIRNAFNDQFIIEHLSTFPNHQVCKPDYAQIFLDVNSIISRFNLKKGSDTYYFIVDTGISANNNIAYDDFNYYSRLSITHLGGKFGICEAQFRNHSPNEIKTVGEFHRKAFLHSSDAEIKELKWFQFMYAHLQRFAEYGMQAFLNNDCFNPNITKLINFNNDEENLTIGAFLTEFNNRYFLRTDWNLPKVAFTVTDPYFEKGLDSVKDNCNVNFETSQSVLFEVIKASDQPYKPVSRFKEFIPYMTDDSIPEMHIRKSEMNSPMR